MEASGSGKVRPGQLAGKGLKFSHGKTGVAKRHRKIVKDTVRGITKGDIRRLARRGGVKRISGSIYDDAREAIKAYLSQILHDCSAFVEYRGRTTITVSDVIFALKRIGRPIYGFDVDINAMSHRPEPRKSAVVSELAPVGDVCT